MTPVPEGGEQRFSDRLFVIYQTRSAPRNYNALIKKSKLSEQEFYSFISERADTFGEYLLLNTDLDPVGVSRHIRVFTELIMNAPDEKESVALKQKMSEDFDVEMTRVGQMMYKSAMFFYKYIEEELS